MTALVLIVVGLLLMRLASRPPQLPQVTVHFHGGQILVQRR
jgi:hypothetical protein